MTDTVVIRGSSEATVVVESSQIQVVDVGIQGPRGQAGLGVPTTNLVTGAIIAYDGSNFSTLTEIPTQITLNGGNF
jgi:hypothetical protein